MLRLGPCVRPHATFMSLYVIQITVELYPESEDKEEEESGTWCWWCHCGPRMQSNCVFINRKFLFSQLKMGNKEVLFWNTSLPSFIWCSFILCITLPPHPQGQESQNFFSTNSSLRLLFQEEWASLRHLPHPPLTSVPALSLPAPCPCPAGPFPPGVSPPI